MVHWSTHEVYKERPWGKQEGKEAENLPTLHKKANPLKPTPT